MSLSLITLFSCLLLVSHPVIRLHQLLAECSITFYNALENKLIHSLAQFSSSRDHFWGWSLKFVLTPAGLLSAVSFSGSGLWFSLLFSQNYLLLLIMHRQNLQSFWETSRCKLPTYSVSNKMSSFGDLKSSLFLRNASPPGEKKKNLWTIALGTEQESQLLIFLICLPGLELLSYYQAGTRTTRTPEFLPPPRGRISIP